MSETKGRVKALCRYFVDEAGDPTLFSAKKGKPRPIVGTEGCSRFFILGVTAIPQYEELSTELVDLRMELLRDPFFKSVPSMQPERKKTALAFHAKDDLPEVRWQVFKLLHGHDLRFLAAVKNKFKVIDYVRQRNASDGQYRYNPNELYDYMVRRLFSPLLHKHDSYDIYFAERGKADRTEALRRALVTAQTRFADKHVTEIDAAVEAIPSTPAKCLGLQVTDYLLWALQRFYERRDDRYLEYMWPAFRLVIDIDDARKAQYGRYYDQENPLILKELDEMQGI